MQNKQPENNGINKSFSLCHCKPKESFDESLFYVLVWVLPTGIDES